MLRKPAEAAAAPAGRMPLAGCRQRVLIVEDDMPSALRLRDLLGLHCPELEVVGMAHDFESAASMLRRGDFEVAFLDVELDGVGTCFQILNELDQPRFKVVIVSAFERYAIPAIRLSAVDYLVKPVDIAELLGCRQRLLGLAGPQARAQADAAPRKVILRQGDQVYIKELTELLFLKARGFYTQVHFYHQGGLRAVTVSKPLNELEAEWRHPGLIRVHKSFMINMTFVQQVRKSGDGLLLSLESGVQVPVARRRAATFMSQYSA